MLTAVRAIARAAPVRTALAASPALRGAGARRSMAAGPAVEYTGFEAKVRAVAPKDEHLVVAILGFYTGMYVVFKMGSALFSSPKKEAPAAAAPADSGGEIPSVDSEAFATWIDGEGNLEKWVASIEK